ncbi:PstS family phosphate ABC transporter substrate-binding protein [Psychrobacillus sp. NPDC093200]|uniref:PstS family phosphate ABC transporter substrate-binding protein n=1 Tax=Psychrobacillus sp. NPDC093200 TaxID=3390656 RepID=UPI003D014400
MDERKESLRAKIFYAFFSLIGLSMITFFILVVLALTGNIYYIATLITGAIALYLFFIFRLFNFFTTKKRTKWFLGIMGIALAISAITPVKKMYENSIPTVGAELDIWEYQPFIEPLKIATLEEEASLKITDNLPKMDGATALYPLYASFAQAVYPEKTYEPGSSEVMVNTTPDAYNNLIQGKVDMIFVAQPSQEQINHAKRNGVELKLTPIGREAFVFFVHQKNEVDGLSIKQIQDIYSGSIKNWQNVGGSDDSIRAFQRPEGSGSQTALQNLMGETPLMEAPTEDIVNAMDGIIEEVAQYKNYKNAIGYTFRYYSNEMVKNDQIKLLNINGIAPTKENIRNNQYPIASEYYVITTNTKNPYVDELIEWILSPQGQELVEKTGYVPIHE